MTGRFEGVAFICFNATEGIGGHYLSLAETAQSGLFYKPVVIDIGFAPVPLLDAVRTEHIPYFWHGNGRARRAICELVAKHSVKIVLCYDIPSFIIVQRALAGGDVRIIYVKCGGPLLTLYYPRPCNVIVYSNEDEEFFRNRVSEAKIARIPNRVRENEIHHKQVKLENEVISQHLSEVQERIVCIARISHAYERKIRRAFDYCRSRRAAGQSAALTVIGTIQHSEIANALFSDAPSGTIFLTEPQYTRDAARFLSQFHSAITTGRGTVEAVLSGLNVFVPFDASERLAILSPANFRGLMHTNFSGRAKFEEVPDQRLGTLSDVEKLETFNLVRSEFTLEHAHEPFHHFFDKLRHSPSQRRLDIILGWLYLRYDSLRERSRLARYFMVLLTKMRRLTRKQK